MKFIFFTFYLFLFYCKQGQTDEDSFGCISPLDKSLHNKSPVKCNLLMSNPKKIINPYKDQLENYVQSKPFASICLKCSMCLAIAKEMDQIFQESNRAYEETRQDEAVSSLREKINSLCANGFEKHDLRRYKKYKFVTDEFKCTSHVRSTMDGRWTEKLREMCSIYLNYMDIQYLLNDYLKKTNDLTNYLCRNKGIFRDCTSLNFQNTSMAPPEDNFFYICT